MKVKVCDAIMGSGKTQAAMARAATANRARLCDIQPRQAPLVDDAY